MKIPLFDVDWTLLKGGNKPHNDAFDYAFQFVYGVEASIGEIVHYGMIDTQIIIEVLKLHAISEATAKKKLPEALRAMEEYYVIHENEGIYIPMPGVHRMLQALKQKAVPVGLLTGNIEPIAWGKLTQAEIRDFFSFGAFGNMAYKRPDLIKIAVEQAKKRCDVDAPLTDFVIIGDSPLDVACAQAGGIEAIAVGAGPYSAQELRAAGANLVVSSLQEQEKVFDFLNV